MNSYTKLVFGLVFGLIISTGILGGGASASAQYTSGYVSGYATASPASECLMLGGSLYRGLTDSYTGGDVSRLQAFLNTQGYFPYAPVGIFGPFTMHAVQNFQAAHGVNPTGYVGPITRGVISQVSCGTSPNPIPTGQVWIQSLSPTSGVVGTSVTIYGQGLGGNSTIYFGGSPIKDAYSTYANSLTFTIPDHLGPACSFATPPCYTLVALKQVMPGTYSVYVQNSSGTSNTLNFQVTGTGQSGTPSINSIAPSSGGVGTTVTIYGQGFTHSNTIHFGLGGVMNVDSSNGTTLTYTIPQSMGPLCAPGMYCAQYLQQVTAGSYNISVENSQGTSNAASFLVTDSATQVSITGIDAPTALPVGQSGTWTVHATAPASQYPYYSGNLHYGVVWGDEGAYAPMSLNQQNNSTSATFTHTYATPGNYNPLFTVTTDQGQSASASASVTVGGSAVGSTPSITSLSPASGNSGITVTIHGTNFDTAGNNTIAFGEYFGRHHLDGSADNVVDTKVSPDGTTLTFTVPNTGPSGILCNSSNQCVGVSAILLQAGTYSVAVSNKWGTSNTGSFYLTR
jgi:peptidoglycan hydrolase-like protein with peptidoglycan-binding domain